jgi:hypothetical protein
VAAIVVTSQFTASLSVAPFAPAASDQQNKMKACNDQANAIGLAEGKSDQQKAFMNECFSAKPPKSGKPAQQEKLKGCNKEASKTLLKGDQWKKFMSPG